MSPDDRVRVNILLDAEQGQAVSEKLREAGLQIEQELGLLGIITGAVPQESMAALAAIEGVLAVEEDREVTLPEE